MEATIRKSITSLTSGQTYYFRTLAKNSSSTNNGEDWANSSTAFTTVTSSVREETEAVRYSDLEGWWKLDGNLDDSSGNNRHGDGVFFKPTLVNGLKLWLDASDLSTAGATWTDKSGNGNHATKHNTPTVVTNAQNGLSLMRYDKVSAAASTDYHEWNDINDMRTIFAVFKRDSGNNGGILTDDSVYHFFSHGTQMIHSGHGHANIRNGLYKLNGSSITAISTNYPAHLSIVAIRPTGNVEASRIGRDRSSNNYHFDGDYGELIVFNTALSDDDMVSVEGYLAHKWGLTGLLPSTHSYKSTKPLAVDSSPFSSDIASATGTSLDLSNGVFATVSTGGTEDVFDGGSAFSTSMWVKGWPSAAGEAIIGKDHFDPGAFGSLKVWLDASNPDYLSKSGPTDPPSAGDSFTKWYDLSGNNHHASTGSGTPSWESSLINSNPGVKLDGSTLVLDNSAVAFDEWSELHVFAVLRIHANTTWKRVFGKTSSASSSANTAWSYSIRRGDASPPTYFARVRNNSNADFNRESGNSRTTSLHDSPGGLFTMSWGGGSFTNRIDGTQNSTVSSTGTIGSLSSEPVKIGQGYGLYFGEFLIFDEKLSSADEQKIEGYLAHKWGFAGDLPSSGHSGKSAAPTAGWGIKRAASGNDNLTLNMVGAGGELTKAVAVNDNDWHHVVTTYGGGNKKIYIDGVEKATVAQTGSVTASSAKLTMGDFIPFGNITGPKIDDVRFYSVALSAAEIAAIYNEGENDVGAPKFAITSPATINASTNKPINYQITTDAAYGMTGYNSTITYSLLNAPNWLSVGSSSGAVSGTPPASGTFTFQVKATNTLGTGIKDITITVSDYGNWNYALSFTTDYNSNDPLQDWNMLVRLSQDSSNGAGNAGFRYSQASSNGGDLRFITKAGEELNYEIANWNTAGESQVWVRVPSLNDDENVTMYWGNANAGLPAYANNGSTWDDYFGVYHLEGTAGTATDSSPLSNDLPGVNAPVMVASGLSGASYSSTSAANNGFLGSISSHTRGKEGTYTIWANTPSNPPDWKDFFGLEYNEDSGHRLQMVVNNASPAKANVFVNGGSSGFSGITNPNDNLGGWQMLTLVIKGGYVSVYVNGVLDGTAGWYFPGLDTISKVAIGKGTADGGPDTTFDEATFSTVGRSADWLLASYNNQKPDQSSNPYLNFENLVGPISLDDPDNSKIFGKKDTAISSYTVAHSGNGSFSATGLPPGLNINSATGVISGSTSVVGSQSVTITATGSTAGGGSVTVSKTYTIEINDPASFPFRMNLTLSGYTGSSTLSDFPSVSYTHLTLPTILLV